MNKKQQKELMTLIKECTEFLNGALSDDELWKEIGILKYYVSEGYKLTIGTFDSSKFESLMKVGNEYIDKLKEKNSNQNLLK